MGSEYDEYYQTGGTYVLPVEVFNQLLEENKKLKTLKRALMSCLKIDKEKIDYYADRCETLEKILDEIREYIMQQNVEVREYYSCDMDYAVTHEKLLQILDKAGKE